MEIVKLDISNSLYKIIDYKSMSYSIVNNIEKKDPSHYILVADLLNSGGNIIETVELRNIVKVYHLSLANISLNLNLKTLNLIDVEKNESLPEDIRLDLVTYKKTFDESTLLNLKLIYER